MEILQGTISAVVFQNYENGYAVLRLAAQDGNTVTVVGTIPMPSVGEQLMVTGRWGNHSGYGRQFEAEFLERLLPQTESQILAFLSGRAVKGIGPKTAGRIVSRFGAKTLEIMEREPEQLAQVPGISPCQGQGHRGGIPAADRGPAAHGIFRPARPGCSAGGPGLPNVRRGSHGPSL